MKRNETKRNETMRNEVNKTIETRQTFITIDDVDGKPVELRNENYCARARMYLLLPLLQ